MAYWLLKTEPDCYSWPQLVRDGSTVWDGITNNAALKHLRSTARGDRAFVYHTGNEKAVVGIATLTSGPYPDPRAGDTKRVVVDLKPLKPLARPVTLAEIKSDPRFGQFELVRISRLGVMPVPPALWQAILAMSRAS